MSFPFEPGSQNPSFVEGRNRRAALGPEAPPERGLDSNGLSTCGHSGLNDTEGARRTFDRYRFQRHAAKILDWPKGLSACEWARQFRTETVEVWRNTSPERGSWSRFVGLQTCGGVWTCPVCSNRRAWRRRQDLQKLVEYAEREGLTLVMLTLTSQHDLGTALKDQRAMMGEAKSRMAALAAFKKGLGKHLVGSVTATEVTHGKRTGWHLHYHYILMLDLRDLSFQEREPKAQALGEAAWPAWRQAATKAGLHVSRAAYSVEVGKDVGRYPGDAEKIEKQWTLADEATRGAVKKGKKDGVLEGRHPFELLRLSCDENDGYARRLFIEYAAGMKHAAALMWSRGLAGLVGVKEDKAEGEEKAEASEVVREKAGYLTHGEWRGEGGRKGVRLRRGRMAVAVARDGAEGLERERDSDRADPTAAELAGSSDPGPLVEDDDLDQLVQVRAEDMAAMPDEVDDLSPAKVTDQDYKGGRGQDYLPGKLDVVRGDVHVDASAVMPDASIGPSQSASHAHQFSPGIGAKTCRQRRSLRSVQPAYAGREEPPAGPLFFRS